MVFRARAFEFQFPRATLVMGVVNVTPDSFSDGGRFLEPAAAVEHALRLVHEGADILDIGGESTRPGADPVSEAEELRRVIPVVEEVARRVPVAVSIDTQKPAVARAALEAGASLVNDVGANREDPGMWQTVAQAGAGYVLMHMQGTPRTMQHQAAYRDVVAEVGRFFEDRLCRLQASGVRAEQVALDVGIGFGKTVEHNLQLLAQLERFKEWERPLLLGVSRKSFIGKITGEADPMKRLPGSLAAATWAVLAGVHIVRAHDVAATCQALRLVETIRAARHAP
jgi:dihydropteroate synthase